MKYCLLAIGLAASGARAADTAMTTLKNSNGWSMAYPKCWAADGIEDVDSTSSNLVNIIEGISCSEKMSVEVQITSITTGAPNTPDERIKSSLQSLKEQKIPAVLSQVMVGNDKVAAVHSVQKNHRGEILAGWTIESTCSARKLTVNMSYVLSAAESKKPIEKRVLPPVLRAVADSFKCH